MTNPFRSLVVAAALAVPALAQPAENPTKQADVPVKAVVLFSSGVGYFEHFGTVSGDGSTELRFKTNQINDILKSLILQDLDNGKITTITYPSQDPIGKTLASFQVNISGNPPLADLLNQLRGAKVTLSMTGNDSVEGTILGVETRQKPQGDNKPPVTVSVINILTGATIRSVELDQLRELKLNDQTLQEELTKALTALAQARDQDKKPVTINFTGQGDRRVRMGYVVETPIWKTSYRLIMPSDPKDKSKMQGWAIVENQTDNDWNNVQLSLVSGRPISFVQDLYQPLYIPRPVVQPELYASLRPQTYEGGSKDKAEAREMDVASAAPAPAAKSLGRVRRAGAPGGTGGGMQLDSMAEPAAPMDASASVASVASASKVGELFQYTVGNVSLPRQKSAMIPIITDDIEVEKVSIYNASVLPRNPLNGARVKNTTDKHLLQGPITVLEAGSYAGDARIDDLPPGQERFLSYGIDLQMTVDATKNNSSNAVQTGKIVKGVLFVTRKHVFVQEYVAENKSDREKTLIVEHPRRGGDWKLIDSEKPMETTDAVYRFKGKVPLGQPSKLTVKEEIVQDEAVAILNIDPGALEMYRTTGEIPAAVKEVLAKAIKMRQDITDTDRQVNEHNQQIAEITAEQNRIRENMKTVSQQSQYYNRLLEKLNTQESSLEKLQTERDDLQKKRATQQNELEQYLANTTVG